MARPTLITLFAALSLALAGCGPSLTISEQAAAYFNLVDGAEFTYESEGGLIEIHEYNQVADAEVEDREIFERTARRGGFLEDESTFTLEVTDDRTLEISRYYDCLTRCGELSNPVVIFDFWPLESGQVAESDTVVTLTRNGEPDGERVESHRFQVGAPETVEVPAGSFEEAFPVAWTRTIDGDTQSATFVIAETAGFLVIEPFGGSRMELTAGPVGEDDGES